MFDSFVTIVSTVLSNDIFVSRHNNIFCILFLLSVFFDVSAVILCRGFCCFASFLCTFVRLPAVVLFVLKVLYLVIFLILPPTPCHSIPTPTTTPCFCFVVVWHPSQAICRMASFMLGHYEVLTLLSARSVLCVVWPTSQAICRMAFLSGNMPEGTLAWSL